MLEKLVCKLPIKLNGSYYVDFIVEQYELDLFEMYSNENVAKYVAAKTHRTLEDTVEFMELMEHRMKLGNNIYLGIYNSQLGKLIGLIRFLEKEDPEVLTIGYALNEKYWGKGIVPMALEKLIDLINMEEKYTSLRATVRPENRKSARCLEKLGFQCRGPFFKQKAANSEVEEERLLYLKELRRVS